MHIRAKLSRIRAKFRLFLKNSDCAKNLLLEGLRPTNRQLDFQRCSGQLKLIFSKITLHSTTVLQSTPVCSLPGRALWRRNALAAGFSGQRTAGSGWPQLYYSRQFGIFTLFQFHSLVFSKLSNLILNNIKKIFINICKKKN